MHFESKGVKVRLSQSKVESIQVQSGLKWTCFQILSFAWIQRPGCTHCVFVTVDFVATESIRYDDMVRQTPASLWIYESLPVHISSARLRPQIAAVAFYKQLHQLLSRLDPGAPCRSLYIRCTNHRVYLSHSWVLILLKPLICIHRYSLIARLGLVRSSGALNEGWGVWFLPHW